MALTDWNKFLSVKIHRLDRELCFDMDYSNKTTLGILHGELTNGLNHQNTTPVKTSFSSTCYGIEVPYLEITNDVVATLITVSIINTFASIFATISNALVLVAISTKKLLRIPSNILLTSMCVSDLLVGLIVQPLFLVNYVEVLHGVHTCILKQIAVFFAISCAGASFINAALVTMDRCYAICLPYNYLPHRLNKKYIITIIIVWIFVFSISMQPLLGTLSLQTIKKLFSAIGSTILVFVITCYIMINKILQRHLAEIKSLQVSEKDTKATVELKTLSVTVQLPKKEPTIRLGVEQSSPRLQQQQQQQQGLKSPSLLRNTTTVATTTATTTSSSAHEIRRSYTIQIILVIFIICYIPQVIVFTIAAITSGFSNRAFFVTMRWCEMITFLNSSINPLIYCMRVSNIRAEVYTYLRKIRRWICCKGNNSTINTADVR